MEELGLTISQLVELQLPAGFSVSQDYLDKQIKVWQLLVYEAAKVPPEEKYNIEAYSDEWKILLAYMLVWNIYQRILAGAFAMSVGSSSGETGSSRLVKKITTGPTDVEYHDTTKGLAEAFKSFKGPGGLIDQLMAIACPLGSRLGIRLPFCPANDVNVCFQIARGNNSCCGSASAIKTIICHDLHKPESMG